MLSMSQASQLEGTSLYMRNELHGPAAISRPVTLSTTLEISPSPVMNRRKSSFSSVVAEALTPALWDDAGAFLIVVHPHGGLSFTQTNGAPPTTCTASAWPLWSLAPRNPRGSGTRASRFHERELKTVTASPSFLRNARAAFSAVLAAAAITSS